MAMFERDAVRLHYEIEGDGEAVLGLAPGGMRSSMDRWQQVPWNPVASLRATHRVICMDQRNAGQSSAPVSGDDGWSTYAADQLALLDHLGVDRCHVIGMCIGATYALRLVTTTEDRFSSAVLLQPVGVADNREILRQMFDQWGTDIAADHPETTPAEWTTFGDNMWNGDFALTATREQVAACATPMLVMMGNDEYHPEATSREIASLAPGAALVERWKDSDSLAATDTMIKEFLARNSA